MNGRQGWFDVWQAKGKRALAEGRSPGLRDLVALSGYDSPTSALDLNQYDRQLRHIVDSLAIGPDDHVYEVGCGAGALLWSLQNLCAGVGGSDYAPALVEIAAMVLDTDDLAVLEAREVPVEPRYDVVVSNGVFVYFPDAEYAWDVTERMAAKARRAVGIFDVNDLATREEHRAVRGAAYGHNAVRTEIGQLYLDRAGFVELAGRLGMTCVIEDSVMTGSANARFRYNVLMFHTGGRPR
ncbi:methyltransferase [Jiangella rhizosphaerae]|uniref:Methyltransferase domain-containing protein n=1 Tax=Jiangella rhizosphaerae TaxID=2293569 RepID=A0A418KS49_9ACTN|nr:methyltransferase [Jiangella rhizosphaerae]RIQ25264.1 methyltransferase domain-containing protein [Jiangella rhizosphaerae]